MLFFLQLNPKKAKLKMFGIPLTKTMKKGLRKNKRHYPLGTTDEYFKAPEPDEEYIVHLCGDTVILSNGLLVQALSRLPAQKQEMLYLSFFKRMPQHEIGRRYGRSRSAVGYHIRKAIQQLYEEMEGLAHEE